MTRVAPTPTLTDATLYAGDPYPTYAWLRANAPVYWDAASNLWVCSRYDDVVVCTYDLNRFSASVVMDIMRTHPQVIFGGILQENPFYVAPAQFLAELRARAAAA